MKDSIKHLLELPKQYPNQPSVRMNSVITALYVNSHGDTVAAVAMAVQIIDDLLVELHATIQNKDNT